MEYGTDYIQVLIDSSKKKVKVLEDISRLNEEQKILASGEKLDLEKLEVTLEGKQDCIDELNKLDEGFELIYERVKPEILGHASDHKEQIQELKELVALITEKSMAVQAEEERNKQAIAAHFASYKKEIRQFKASKSAASNYYKNMNNLQSLQPMFMDKKK